jgi:hypothetical protein
MIIIFNVSFWQEKRKKVQKVQVVFIRKKMGLGCHIMNNFFLKMSYLENELQQVAKL